MYEISNGKGSLVVHPGSRVLDIYDVCEEGIKACFNNDGVCDYLRQKIPEIKMQKCSNDFLVEVFIEPMRKGQ